MSHRTWDPRSCSFTSRAEAFLELYCRCTKLHRVEEACTGEAKSKANCFREAGACHGVLGSQPRRKHPAPWRMPISTRLRRILAQSGRTTQWRLCLHLWAQKPCAVAAAAAISACGRAAHWDQSLALYDHWCGPQGQSARACFSFCYMGWGAMSWKAQGCGMINPQIQRC